MNVNLPPEESSLEEITGQLEAVRKEHSSLLSEIAEARQFQQNREVQQKQIEDQFEFLRKEQLRLQNWEDQIKTVEDGLNIHHTLIAQKGTLFGQETN